jgi:hypothetical protein
VFTKGELEARSVDTGNDPSAAKQP